MAGSQVVPVATGASFGSLHLDHRHADVFDLWEYVQVNEERLHGEGAVPGTSVEKYLAVPSAYFIGPSRRELGVFPLPRCLEQAESPGGNAFYLDLI